MVLRIVEIDSEEEVEAGMENRRLEDMFVVVVYDFKDESVFGD